MSASESEIDSPAAATLPRKKKRVRSCEFQDCWLQDSVYSDWLARHDDKTKARCLVCSAIFTVKFDGVKALKHHADSKKHKLFVQSRAKSNVVSCFFVNTKDDPLSDKVTSVKIAKTYHCVKHHYSYLSMDCGNKLDTSIYSDSDIAAKIKLQRTKMESLVKNVICPYSIQIAVQQMTGKIGAIPFSISTDASNKGNRKFFPLAVRIFDVNQGVKDYLLDFYEESDESSGSIVNTIAKALENLGLSLKNVVAYGADNASVNYGVNCSVYEKLLKVKDTIIKANCNCHVLHNPAKHSVKKITYDVESLVIKVFNHFSTSSKRVAELKACFDFVEEEYHLVLHHIPVRWLSLFTAIERLILNWNAIKTYFLQIRVENCDRLLWSFISVQEDGISEITTIAECYLFFFHSLLSIFQKPILTLEKSVIQATDLFDIMARLKNHLESRIKDEFFGVKAGQGIQHLENDQKRKFKEEALEVYTRALDYLQKWFDFEDLPFKKFACLKLQGSTPSIDDLLAIAELFKLNNPNVSDDLYDELVLLCTAAPAFFNDEALRSADKWCKFFCDTVAPILKRIVQHVFAVPCSNAYVECVFSIMNNLWSDERNRLGVDTVKAELCIRLNIDMPCLEFYEHIKTNKRLIQAAKSSAKYSFKQK